MLMILHRKQWLMPNLIRMARPSDLKPKADRRSLMTIVADRTTTSERGGLLRALAHTETRQGRTWVLMWSQMGVTLDERWCHRVQLSEIWHLRTRHREMIGGLDTSPRSISPLQREFETYAVALLGRCPDSRFRVRGEKFQPGREPGRGAPPLCPGWYWTRRLTTWECYWSFVKILRLVFVS